MKRRLLSIALVLCMVLALMPTALAGDDVDGISSNDSSTNIESIGSTTQAAEEGDSTTTAASITVNGEAKTTLADAFAAANAVTGTDTVTITISAGTFAPTENEQLKITRDNVVIQGAGVDKTIIECGTYSCSGQGGIIIGASNVTLKDMTVTSNATSGNVAAIKVTCLDAVADGEQMTLLDSCTLENLKLTSENGHGLNLHGVQNCTVNNVTATGNGKCGISLANAPGVTISNSTLSGNWGDIGMMYAADNPAYGNPCKLTLGEGNTFTKGVIYAEARTDDQENAVTLTANQTVDILGINIVEDGGTLTTGAASVAKISGTDGTVYYPTLQGAIAAADSGATITLLNDVTLTVPATATTGAVEVSKDVTIDLNGKTITGQNTRVFHVKSGKLTLTGEGTVTTVAAETTPISVGSSVIRVGDGSDWTQTSETATGLVIGKDVVIEAPATYGVSVFGSGTTETATVYGKIHSTATTDASYNGCAISTLGTDINTPATVNIMEGAVLTAANTNAVYAPSGTLNISGGTITGTTGVYFKSTNMTISGGTITGNGEKKDYEYYGDGGISTGDALTIDSCNYPGGINTISVTGGTFISKNAAAVGSYNSNGDALLTGFITGGTFSTDPIAYVKNNGADYIVRKDSDTSYTVVAKENLTSGVYMSDPSGSVASGYVVSGSGPYTVSVYIPTTTTTTTTNDDGSKTTTTTDKSTGATTETTTSQPVTDEAGNTTQTTTETVTQKDGSTTETVTETVKAADGSTATKVTETNGAGETSTTVEATVSTQAVTQAAETDTAVTIPVAVTAVKAEDSEIAAVVTVNVPSAVTEDNTVQVEIPVENLTTGTVAVVVNADGTEEIVKTSTLGEDGVVLTLEGDATVKIVDNSKIFEDVHPVDHWAEDAVTYVAARDIFNGTGNNNFSPDEDLTRAMLMTVLARYDGQDTTGGETWYEQGMNWAMQTGVSDGSDPEVSITREQMVTMIWRYAGKPESNHALDFNDAHDINDWAEEAMRWAVSTGIINGVGNNALDPRGPATRAQVATVMMRFCENIAK